MQLKKNKNRPGEKKKKGGGEDDLENRVSNQSLKPNQPFLTKPTVLA